MTDAAAGRRDTRVVEPDLVIEFAIARAHGRSLLGSAPEAVVGAVPAGWLLEIGDRQLAAWQKLTDDADHAELMVLTACRTADDIARLLALVRHELSLVSTTR